MTVLFKDALGTDVRVGDPIVYSVKNAGSVYLKKGIVLGYEEYKPWPNSQYTAKKIKVLMGRMQSKWGYVEGKYTKLGDFFVTRPITLSDTRRVCLTIAMDEDLKNINRVYAEKYATE